MDWPDFGQERRSRRRTPEQLQRMAWNPSSYAPAAADLLTPTFPEPMPKVDPEESTLIEAIRAEPAAAAPKLAYGRWLKLQGDPRGEWILELLESGDPNGRTEVSEGARQAWAKALHPWSVEDLEYDQGVLVGVSLAGRSFVSLGESLLRRAPISAIRFVAVRHLWPEFVACPLLTWLRRINLRGNALGPEAAEALAACPHLGRLRELNLARNKLGQRGVRAIQEAPWASNLEALDLSDND